MKYLFLMIGIFALLSSCLSIDIFVPESDFPATARLSFVIDKSNYIDVSRYRTNSPEKAASSIPSAILGKILMTTQEGLAELVSYMIKDADDEVLKVKIIHDWIALNIKYDAASYIKNIITDQSWEAVLKTRLAVCEGYSNLFYKMCSLAGIRVETVHGYARGAGYSATAKEVIESNHAWNAVFLYNNWYLVDSTWDAGYLGRGNSFVKEYSTSYFLLDPSQMLYTHFPSDPRWQLLENPKSPSQFLALPNLAGKFFDYFDSSELPFSNSNNVSGQHELVLKTLGEHAFSFTLADSRGIVIENRILEDRLDDEISVRISFPKADQFLLSIFAGEPGKSYLEGIAEINFTASEGSAFLFPQNYLGHYFTEFSLRSPLSGVLEINKTWLFELYLPEAKELFLSNGKEMMPFRRTESGRFLLDYVPKAKGEKIQVLSKVPGKNSYNILLVYSSK